MLTIDEMSEAAEMGTASDERLVSVITQSLTSDRQTYLNGLKEQLDNGTYNVSSELIADSMMSRVSIDAMLGN
jgi:anti-sigma28 factor (negative regulator of flagellin synthesis)